MSLLHIKDGGGSTMELVNVDGFYICTFLRPAEEMASIVREMKNLKCRSDDIFICASMKSGTHWVWEITSMLCNRKAECIPTSKVRYMIEANLPEEIDAFKSPRVLNTHMGFSNLPDEMKKLDCKIVFVLRNPKDVMVSHYNHVIGCKAYKYDGKWEQFYQLFMDGQLEYNSWFNYTREWYDLIQNRPDLNIHVVYYENLKKNSLHEIRRLGEFLGVDNSNDLYESIDKTCQFKEMSKLKIVAISPEDKDRIFQNDFNMYRKGQHGDWVNWFTVAQNEHFDKVYEDKMADRKFNFQFRPNT